MRNGLGFRSLRPAPKNDPATLTRIDDGWLRQAIDGTSGPDTRNGTAGADYFNMSQGGIDTVNGGGGNDVIFFGNTFNSSDRAFGGSGDDQLQLSGNYTFSITSGMINSIEAIGLFDGFTFNITLGGNIAADGVRFSIYGGTTSSASVMNINGSAVAGDLSFFATLGNDVLVSGSGDDYFDYRAGGDDLYDAGAGTIDHLNFTSLQNGVTFDLAVTGAQSLGVGSLRASGFENIGATAFNDRLFGNSSANFFVLEQGGTDVVDGRDGDDTARFGNAWNSLDRFDGGNGYDQVHLSGNYSGLTVTAAMIANVEAIGLFDGGSVNLTLAADSVAAGRRLHIYSSEQFTAADSMAIDASAVAGIIDFRSSAGSDILVGGSGGDTFAVVPGGDDFYDGGAGPDYLNLSSIQSGVTIDLAATGAQVVGNGSITITNFENAGGTAFNDRFVGTVGGNYFDLGQGGNDTVDGGAGDDFIHFGDTFTARDRVIGGDGYDQVRLSGVYARLTITGAMIIGVEGLNFANGGSYTLTLGSDVADSVSRLALYGGDISDPASRMTIDGSAVTGQLEFWSGAGDDTLTGGLGNDTFIVGGNGGGNDVFRGGAGANYLNLTPVQSGVTIDLGRTTQQAVGTGSVTISDISGVGGTAFDDRITGTDGDNYIDLSFGAGGSDTVDGKAGNDTVFAGSTFGTSDRLKGGEGFDQLRLAGTYAGLTITARMLSGFEALSLTPGGNYDLTLAADLVGSDQAFQIYGPNDPNNPATVRIDASRARYALGYFGGGGNDVALGGLGNDFFRYTGGDDSYDGGGGYNRVSFYFVPNGITIDLNLATAQTLGAIGSVILADITDVSGTQFTDRIIGDGGDNQILSNGGNDSLSGGGGNDIFVAGAAPDGSLPTLVIVDGGNGRDLMSFATNAANAGVTVSLLARGTQTTGQGGFRLTGIEDIHGTFLDDTITGDRLGNTLYGFGGIDRLSGGAGDDRLFGDGYLGQVSPFGYAGPTVELPGDDPALFDFADMLDGGAGNDLLDGGAGADILIGGEGRDTLRGGPGADRFVFQATADTPRSDPDTIVDFEVGDRIDPSTIDADTVLAGDQAFHLGRTPGRVGDILVSFDAATNQTTVNLFVDGDRVADATILLAGNVALTATDFIL